jgi:hypothetical protein
VSAIVWASNDFACLLSPSDDGRVHDKRAHARRPSSWISRRWAGPSPVFVKNVTAHDALQFAGPGRLIQGLSGWKPFAIANGSST